MTFERETCAVSKNTCESHMLTCLISVSGASRVRDLPPVHFCSHGFVLGKASEAGFGNEMYKILTAAVLSIMLNRSLIIGQTRHIGSFSSLSVLYSKLAFLYNEFSYKQMLVLCSLFRSNLFYSAVLSHRRNGMTKPQFFFFGGGGDGDASEINVSSRLGLCIQEKG